jgi:branched-chain amino acid transport system ATP-binding protein
MTAAALSVRRLTAGYGGVPALRELDLSLAPGEVLTVLGANGAGKTTALLSIVGAIAPMAGTVESFDVQLTGRRVDQAARHGVILVPDDRGLFPDLTVAEHLWLACRRDKRAACEEAASRFPQLRALMRRRCGVLSGGEQQMLALAKALALNPRVLLIDEMSLGLAPLVVQKLLPVVRQLATEHSIAVVLVEQHIDLALGVSDSAIVLNRGRVTLAGRARELLQQRSAVEAAYFGGSGAPPR